MLYKVTDTKFLNKFTEIKGEWRHPKSYPALTMRFKEELNAGEPAIIFLSEKRGKSNDSVWLNGVKLIISKRVEGDRMPIAAQFSLEEFKATVPKCVSVKAGQLFYPMPHDIKNFWLLLTITPK